MELTSASSPVRSSVTNNTSASLPPVKLGMKRASSPTLNLQTQAKVEAQGVAKGLPPSQQQQQPPNMESLLSSFVLPRRQSCPMAMAIPMPSVKSNVQTTANRSPSLPREYTFVPDKRSRPHQATLKAVPMAGVNWPQVAPVKNAAQTKTTNNSVLSMPVSLAGGAARGAAASANATATTFMMPARRMPAVVPPITHGKQPITFSSRALTFHQLEFDANTLKAIDRQMPEQQQQQHQVWMPLLNSQTKPLPPPPKLPPPTQANGKAARPVETEEAAHILVALQSQS